jgi:uracil-DNA glycosylase family 4
MSTGVEVTRGELASALGWLVDAGLDTLVDDEPRDWLATSSGAPERVGGQLEAPPIANALRGLPAQAAAGASIAPPDGDARQLAASADSLRALAAAAAQFHTAAPPLFDAGEAAGGLMLVGDAPTADDVAAGHVFGGDIGRLLDRMLASIGRDRGSAYLTNVTYWLGGPDAAALAPFRERQIELARPRAILVFGGVATAALCGVSAGINRLRGQWQMARVGDLEVPVLPTFHPAYLLKQPAHKALAWADLCKLRARLDL